jgi:hypothetical protein
MLAKVVLCMPPVQTVVCGVAVALLSGSAHAQQKRLPESMPSIFSGHAVHTTAPTRIVPGAAPSTALDITNAPIPASTRVNSAADLKGLGGGCTSESVVCYDYRNRSTRLPIAKELMPEVPGLKKENLSVKRDKVTLSYSF